MKLCLDYNGCGLNTAYKDIMLSDSEDDVWANSPVMEVKSSVQPELFEIKEFTHVEKLLDEAVQSITDLLGVTNDQAVSILKYFKWDVSKIESKWFDDPVHYGKLCGITFDSSMMQGDEKSNLLDFDPNVDECVVCYESFTEAKPGAALDCKHKFCDECWKGACEAALSKGTEGVYARCPFLKCFMQIPRSFFKKYCDPGSFEKYTKYLCKSFTDNNKNIKWCPAPGCKYFAASEFGFPDTITCKCGFVFCANCSLESHKPIDCEMLKNWSKKTASDSENSLWLTANTKPCPKCKVSIEKNGGCFYMRCTKCTHEFCWSCLRSWKEHSDHWVCNLYNEQLKNEEFKQQLDKSAVAASELKLFGFYYEKFYSHDQGLKHAKKELEELHSKKEELAKLLKLDIESMEFFDEAMLSILDMRRILKYSYVMGYYSNSAKSKDLFQFQQGALEKYCDILQRLTEEDMRETAKEINNSAFFKYKSELSNCYNVCRKYYKSFCETQIPK
eukprot:TRINITY_DN6072_c0_g1_i2.p1 TRINITY_DN6072_c0_g1~~TRINITY_DN6072_c0_g1_i2.p1  ORF type:complete len:502 (+),score=168.25 TRINITY_DN6072_c0_g1_i2:72-1577(+)